MQVQPRFCLYCQVEFLRQAREHPAMRDPLRQHAVAGILGVACFAMEDAAIRHRVHIVHSMWHALACLSMARLEPLLHGDVEGPCKLS